MSTRTHLVERAIEALHDRTRQVSARAALMQEPALPPELPSELPPFPEPPPAIPRPASVLVAMEALEHAGLVPRPRPGVRSRITEELALIRQQVLRGIPTIAPDDGRCARVVMVTSARPGEGKTFTALNLAAAMADGLDTPVLLVDLDGRRGGLGEMLGLSHLPGVGALVSSSAAPEALVRQTAIPGLSIVTAGAVSGAVAPLPADAVAVALHRLARAFPDHMIVLDIPPALATADAGTLAPLVGQVVMVVRAERTQRDEIEAALDVIEGCPDIRLLLNRTGPAANDSFGAQGDYGDHGSPPAP